MTKCFLGGDECGWPITYILAETVKMYVNASWKTHIQIIYKFLNLPPIIIWKNQAKCGKIYLCDYKKNRRKYMNKLILFHGSPNKEINPTYGLGNDKHDYGKGFYLTDDYELAKEWAVCVPNESNGWVHKYELDVENLKILDFETKDVLNWLAELMKHRDAADSKRYKVLSKKFIDKYGIDTADYDVIKGWRANASYFYIAKEFVKDNIDIEILEELLSLGGLGIQYCIKTEEAFSRLKEIKEDISTVDYNEFNKKYNDRDITARARMRELVDSDKNTVTNVFSTLF